MNARPSISAEKSAPLPTRQCPVPSEAGTGQGAVCQATFGALTLRLAGAFAVLVTAFGATAGAGAGAVFA